VSSRAAILCGVWVGALALALPAHADPPTKRMSTTCVEDDAVPTPPGYKGWERSSVTAWEAVQAQGGIVPDIEEDRSHAPPAWWRYPSPLRSAELLAEEAKNPNGLFTKVPPAELKAGDILVRARGAGACGKMAVVAGLSEEQWVTVEAGEGTEDAKKTADPVFFDGKNLRPEAAAYRLSVKQDSTLGHVRELERDLSHLERTIAERPALVARKGRGAVDEKVHDLVDEAFSLGVDPAFQNQRRVLTGRALALAAGLDWPGAAEQARAVLDDAIRKTPASPDAILSRASVHLLAGENDRAVDLAETATAMPGVSSRLHYLVARGLLASGKQKEGLASLKRYLNEDAADPRARQLASTGGKEPALAPPPPSATAGELTFSATPERATLHSKSFDFRLSYPHSWRVVAQTASPAAGVIVEFSTGRIVRDDGEAERAAASLLVQRPEAGEAAALAKKGARNMFPDAKLKSLPPLLPGSKREQFREKQQGSQRMGEVTTFQRDGAVFFVVLNASTASYPKLKDEFSEVVKSLAAPKTPEPAK
jgi:tetratricopeptide (TPR) repeat protein